jgi:hypothetical protein
MPDIVRLRYVGAVPVNVPAIVHGEGGVEPDTIVEFPGKVLESPQGQPDDAVYVESGNPPELRAWPKSLWRDETVTSRKAKE